MNDSDLCNVAEQMRAQCIRCGLCQRECAFLQRHGLPGDLAHGFLSGEEVGGPQLAFECSLCGLCAGVCPVNLRPAEMFLAMRRRSVLTGRNDETSHRILLNYEKRGVSKRFTFYGLPAGCRDVFFPGCALGGMYPSRVLQLYIAMSRAMPQLGIALDCCTRPSHDLGRQALFARMFGETVHYLKGAGVQRVWTACTSCLDVFRNHGEGLETRTVYEFLDEAPLSASVALSGAVVIHDPCVTRTDGHLHEVVRHLVRKTGLAILDMPHQGEKTVCCGEGGAVRFVAPDLAQHWAKVRKRETDGARVLTYCAGCVAQLGPSMPTSHVLDYLFDPQAAAAGRVKPARSPWTYLNRLWLKYRFQRIRAYRHTRERLL